MAMSAQKKLYMKKEEEVWGGADSKSWDSEFSSNEKTATKAITISLFYEFPDYFCYDNKEVPLFKLLFYYDCRSIHVYKHPRDLIYIYIL